MWRAHTVCLHQTYINQTGSSAGKLADKLTETFVYPRLANSRPSQAVTMGNGKHAERLTLKQSFERVILTLDETRRLN